MSEANSQSTETVGYGNGTVIYSSTGERFVGRILNIIEALGLPQKQEESIKGLIQDTIYQIFSEDGVMITPQLHTKIRLADHKKKFPNQGMSVVELVPGIRLEDL